MPRFVATFCHAADEMTPANFGCNLSNRCGVPGRRIRQIDAEVDTVVDFAIETKIMNNLFKILAVISVAGLVLGLADVGNGMFSGLCRAFGAVFFILAYITKALDKAEHTTS